MSVAAWIVLVVTACHVSDSDMMTARDQAREYLLGHRASGLQEAAALASHLREDGSWPDVDYSDKSRSGWLTGEHLERVLALAKALRHPSTPASEHESLIAAIHRGLAYWREHDFKCPNWWHNRIGTPQRLTQIALLLGEDLRAEDLAYLTEVVGSRCKVGNSTGQNRVWLAGNNLMHGLVVQDGEQVAKAAQVIFEQVAVTPKEGIQRDHSFHQHGPQLQMGNYGLTFARDQIQWWRLLRGTRWAIPPEGRDVMRQYLLDGQSWVVWRGYNDISCCGRAFSPDVQAAKGATLIAIMQQMPQLDPDRADAYQAFLARNTPDAVNDLVGCRHFWRSDYLVHRRPDFAITLKMCSKRVTGSESLNSQNLSGYHLADGATYIYRDGEEYRNIFPVWDWRMLPGVTCAQNDGPMPRFGSYRLDTDFVGGVSDGRHGCAVLDYRRDGVSAKKAWFFLGDSVVCLGSAIRASTQVKAPLVTTLNQCRLRSDVRIGDGQTARKLEPGTHHFEDAAWIEHDGIRYTLLAPQKLRVSNERRVGHWSRVADTPKMPKQEIVEQIFSLSVEHGVGATDAMYAYGISPAARQPAPPAPQVLCNTPGLQAVGLNDRQVSAVFHQPGRLEYAAGRFIETDAACLVLLDLTDGGKVTVSDPTQALTALNLVVDGRPRRVSLPTGDRAGSSIRVP